jgi:hypothetical protein
VFSTSALANASWTGSTRDGKTLARSPEQGWLISKRTPPTDGIWGVLYMSMPIAAIDALKKHRVVATFNFVHVLVEIDDFQRQLTARLNEEKEIVTVELDLRTWEAIKLGKRLRLKFPDGTVLEDSLRGSGAVMQVMENER